MAVYTSVSIYCRVTKKWTDCSWVFLISLILLIWQGCVSWLLFLSYTIMVQSMVLFTWSSRSFWARWPLSIPTLLRRFTLRWRLQPHDAENIIWTSAFALWDSLLSYALICTANMARRTYKWTHAAKSMGVDSAAKPLSIDLRGSHYPQIKQLWRRL